MSLPVLDTALGHVVLCSLRLLVSPDSPACPRAIVDLGPLIRLPHLDLLLVLVFALVLVLGRRRRWR